MPYILVTLPLAAICFGLVPFSSLSSLALLVIAIFALNIFKQLNDAKAGLIVIKESFDTTTPLGILTFQMLASIAEYERKMISERTRDGLLAAMRRGKCMTDRSRLPFGFKLDPNDRDKMIRNEDMIAAVQCEAGFEPESRPFRPHLTLARCRRVGRDRHDLVGIVVTVAAAVGYRKRVTGLAEGIPRLVDAELLSVNSPVAVPSASAIVIAMPIILVDLIRGDRANVL